MELLTHVETYRIEWAETQFQAEEKLGGPCTLSMACKKTKRLGTLAVASAFYRSDADHEKTVPVPDAVRSVVAECFAEEGTDYDLTAIRYLESPDAPDDATDARLTVRIEVEVTL